MVNNIFLFFILILTIGNIYASYKLFKSDEYEKNQKTYQFFIIWAIPFIGMLLVLFFMKEEQSKPFDNNNSCEVGGDFSGGGGD